MKVYQTNEIKNIALLGSAGSGKTTLAESMVYEAGIIKRRGTVEGKNTMSDYFPVEQEYGYSVFSTVFHVEWNNKKLNIIDCPGSDDFVGGAITALNVTDQAVILINGQYGPEVGTMNAFRNTEKLQKPVIFLVNQLDRDNCDFDQILGQLKEVYGNNCVPVQYPIATGAGFNSVIDVLLMKKSADEEVLLEARRRCSHHRGYPCRSAGEGQGVESCPRRGCCRWRRHADGEVLRE